MTVQQVACLLNAPNDLDSNEHLESGLCFLPHCLEDTCVTFRRPTIQTSTQTVPTQVQAPSMPCQISLH